MFKHEFSVAEQSTLTLHWRERISRVNKDGNKITSFVTDTGNEFSGKVFIDASYEGILYIRITSVTAKNSRRFNGTIQC
jgi:hypothetical protein